MRLRRRCDGKNHRWTRWKRYLWHNPNHASQTRTCPCGAIQRHVPQTGETTIWTPDGVESGLLDRGMTRSAYEELGR